MSKPIRPPSRLTTSFTTSFGTDSSCEVTREVAMATVTAPPDRGTEAIGRRAQRARLSERARDEQRLGWYLVAPAVVVMLAVTAYPLGRAVWLSLYSYRLTDPTGKEFVGLRNYGVVLTDSLWWQDVFTTVFITVVTVAIELVIGFAFAMVMHRIVFGRRTVRTSILIPYGIITVVAAYAWQYAFALDSGFVNEWFGLGDKAWFSDRWSALTVIILAEVWKTTPFISLLLRTLDAYRIFDTIFIMTGGAEDTESVSFLPYRQTIVRTSLGLGSAVSVLLFLSVVLIAFSFIRGFKVDLSRVRGG